MKHIDQAIFIHLFKEAYRKCFGFEMLHAMSESESRHFSDKIFGETGLVIGPKSLKNYAGFILKNEGSRLANPSVATLDTLARYVLGAPYTDEVQRKKTGDSYPFWFQYKNKLHAYERREELIHGNIRSRWSEKVFFKNMTLGIVTIVLFFVITLVIFLRLFSKGGDNNIFIENFDTVQTDSLAARGWFLKSEAPAWWKLRGDDPHHLTLFTLRGDNWADSSDAPAIKDLLLRKIPYQNFTTEVLIDGFIPDHNWQQAGILLMEDTTFAGKSLRLSIAYNDFFGGYKQPPEIIIQAIRSDRYDKSRPEEIVHLPIYDLSASQQKLVYNNLLHIGLKIEKNGHHYKLLYQAGPLENGAFKEAFSGDLNMDPHYIGLFALEGFVKDTSYAPVHFKYFNLINNP
jgi:hypothetical protein